MCGNNDRARSSVTTTSFRSPSTSARVMAVGIGVNQCTQYDDSRGVSTGTASISRCSPRARA